MDQSEEKWKKVDQSEEKWIKVDQSEEKWRKVKIKVKKKFSKFSESHFKNAVEIELPHKFSCFLGAVNVARV